MAEMSGQEIYDNFHNGGGPEGLANCASAVRAVSHSYQARMFDIQQLVAEMESAWEGTASEGARRGAGPLLREHDTASQHFSVAEDLTDRQSGSFSRAKNSVVPVPPAPADVVPWGPMAPGWLPFLQQVKDHGEAARNNVEVMTDYSGASAYNTENLPSSYGELAADQSGVSIAGEDTIDSESFRESEDSEFISGPPPGGGEPGPRGGSPVSGPPPGGPSGGDGASGGPGGGQPGGSSGGQTTLPSDVTTPGGYSPVSGGYPGTALPHSAGDGGRTPSVGPLAGVGFGGSGPGGGAGGFSSEGGRGAAGGSRGVMPGPRGPGFGSGAGVGGEAVAAGGRGGGAGARGASGMHGMPMGGSRGRGDEDDEHKAPTYLEGGDPEDLFGSELLTAPPVIGEDDD